MVSKETETEYNEQGYEEALQNQSKEALEQQLDVSTGLSSHVIFVEKLPSNLQHQTIQENEEGDRKALIKYRRCKKDRKCKHA